MSNGNIINIDDDIYNRLHKPPIIANNYSTETTEQKENFNDLLLTRYEDSSLQPAPSCSCGKLKGAFRIGETCPVCGDTVADSFQSEIKSDVWLVPLPGVPHFITPVSWVIMQQAMRESRFDTLKYLTSRTYRPEGTAVKVPKRVEYLLRQGHKRGFKYFIDNFDKVIADYIDGGGRKIPDKLVELGEYIRANRDNIFTNHLPVPSRDLFPIEKNGSSSYGDKNMTPVINAVRIIQEAESRADTLDQTRMESRMVKCNDLFGEFHFNYMQNVYGKKQGVFRQHVFGGRQHFSARAVITSLYKPHDFREVHFPWTFGAGMFGIQLTNKLVKRGFTLYEVYDILRKAAKTYDPLVNEIFEELIEESPYIGLPIVLQRNPTIRRASALRLYVTRIKPNTNDNTISMSIGNLTGFNADFDGDELNSLSLQDKKMHDYFEPLAPENNVMDLSIPWKISGNLTIHTPTISTAVNWIRHGRDAAYGENSEV